MTSNVIINFGANASQAFKAMHAVKAEMKSVQAQAVATSKSAVRAASVGGPGLFKRGLGALRFGSGIITGFLGYNVLREIFNPIKEGFAEVATSSKGFKAAVDLATDTLKLFGKSLGGYATGDVASSIVQGIADVLFPGAPRLSVLGQAYAATKENDTLLTGSMFTSPVSEYEKWEAKKLEIEKRQLAYVKDTATTLRRMENDLERMNTVDPW